MSLRGVSWPILTACAAVACASAEARFDAQESAHRAVLGVRYPAGVPWSEPSDALGAFAIWTVTEPAPDGFAARALHRARSQHADVALCKYGVIPRLTVGSSLGAVGFFEDYVFLDSHDRVLIAFRRFID